MADYDVTFQYWPGNPKQQTGKEKRDMYKIFQEIQKGCCINMSISLWDNRYSLFDENNLYHKMYHKLLTFEEVLSWILQFRDVNYSMQTSVPSIKLRCIMI